MDPIAQFLNSIPGLSGSLTEMNHRTIDTLRANGFGDAPWLPEIIRQQSEFGWY